VQLLTAGVVDVSAEIITLPLYRGERQDGRNVWYVLTEAFSARWNGGSRLSMVRWAATTHSARARIAA
jgi:hypothetical protein